MAYADPEKEKEYKKKWYEANKARHIKNVRRRTVEHRKHLLSVMESCKQKCSCCPESDSCCLDFHHLDPETKTIAVAEAVRYSWSVERLMEEIAKCIVVCRNCHAKIHKYGLDAVKLSAPDFTLGFPAVS